MPEAFFKRSRERRGFRVEFIGFILVGLVVGFLARAIIPGADPIGILGTLIVGIVGGLLGGLILGNVFESGNTRGVDWMDWLGAVIGAVVVLLIYRALVGRRRTVV
jgi:uncharacterized membrane protein YeaQ/YmgE (transglycosylase-associated protein family)